ncbi:MAG: hypothetical protein JWQ89_574 [Devosia sp.]|uniref:hypothetical protein n=1 Tax=Devosia sp. TaxID=1871048 RepID=UPI002623BC5E|nr:hypothetical protein [Devosia sp.]MDB5538847.1 hypothetical protein [Devosia sp.]
MSHNADCWVDGWEVRDRPDGSYGVYDSHGLLAGPFGRQVEAMAAALQLPKYMRLTGHEARQLNLAVRWLFHLRTPAPAALPVSDLSARAS